MNETIAISIKDLSFIYGSQQGKKVALKDVNIDIKKGEFVTIVGHNGSGKSTLAKLLNGLLLPSKGDIEIFGVSTKDKKQIYNIRSNVGLIFQNPDTQMVASIIEDDVAFGPENLGIEREEIKKRVTDALSAVGMLDYRKHTPFKLSGGQKQRVAIAGVLAMKSQILVLDESTAMLDPNGRKDVMNIITKLNKEQNITVVLITHYMDETLFSDRVIILNRGEIVKNDVPREVFKDYKTLQNMHLCFPIISDISNQLIDKGLKLENRLKNRDELVEELCQLL